MKKAKFLVMSLVLAVLMLAAGVLFVACDEGEEEPPATHTHTWATEWSSDGESHWHACTGEGCTAIADEALHTWDEGEVTTPATYDAAGVRTYTCEVCGREREEAIAQLQHNYSTEWTYDDDNHWHACTDEGFEELKADVAAHDWGDGEVTTPATYDAPGVRTYTCECGATKTEDIAQLVHTYADEYSYNSTHHWYACVDEGYNQEPGDNDYAFLRKDEAYHVFGEGVLSDDGTYKTYTCEDCGYSKTSQIVTVEGDEIVLNEYETVSGPNSTEGTVVPDAEMNDLTWGESVATDQRFARVRGDVYAFYVNGNLALKPCSTFLHNDQNRGIAGWLRIDTAQQGGEHRVFLPKIDYTQYAKITFSIGTNNAPYISMDNNVENRVAFAAATETDANAGLVTLAYDAATQTLKVTFVQGETTQAVTVTDTDVINGTKRATFTVWEAALYTQIHMSPITGIPLTEQEVYTVYSFDNGAECGYDGRYDIVPGVGGQGVFWHNGVYCYDETADVYKWVAGTTKYENWIEVQAQSGTKDVYNTFTIYLPLIDFTTYQNVSFSVRGNNDYDNYIDGVIVDETIVKTGYQGTNSTITFTCVYDAESETVNVTVANPTTDTQATFTVTDSGVINGETPFTFRVSGSGYGAAYISPIINTVTLA